MHVRAIVVGTGFGGAVTACRLAQAGIETLVLERGRRYEANDFPSMPPPNGFLPDTRRLGWGPEQGLVDVQDLDELVSVQAAGYGGGSLIYANVQLRAPEAIFEQHAPPSDARARAAGEKGLRVWPNAYTRATLDPYYDLAGFMLDAAPIGEHKLDASGRDGTTLVKADQLKRVAKKLGREQSFFYPPLAISRKDGTNQHGKGQKACVHCGSCCMGCPHEAKNTLDHNYLWVAELNGAEVRTECEVIAIGGKPGSYEVQIVDHLHAKKETLICEFLFLCAGAVHTTRLLAGAALGDEGTPAQSRVGLGYWPNADAFGVVFDTKHAQYPSWGPTITTTTVFEDRDGDPTRGWFMVQDGGYAEELARMIGLLRSPLWVGRNRFPPPPPDESTVDPSPGAPEPKAESVRAPALRSPLDGVLDAGASGALLFAVPDQLRAVAPELRDELAQWFMPVIVDDTLARAARGKWPWIRRWFGNRVADWFARALKWGTRIFATVPTLSRNAQDALEHLGGLRRDEAAARLLGYRGDAANERAMLLGMGPDRTSGVLRYHQGQMRADLDLFHLAPRYLDEELAMRDIATALGGELRVNPAWSFLGKPITVHSQGGCRMSDEPDHGPLDSNGQVWNCPGLFVFDGSSLPSSVGANPSATIAAVAERNVLAFLRSPASRLGAPNWPEGAKTPGAEEYRRTCESARKWRDEARKSNWDLEPRAPHAKGYRAQPVGLAFDERMRGFHSDPSGVPKFDEKNDAAYRELETKGRPGSIVEVFLTPHVENFARFLEDEEHMMPIEGSIDVRLPGDDRVRKFDVKGGKLSLFHPRVKLRALSETPARVQMEIAGSYTSHRTPPSTVRFMNYELPFEDQNGNAWELKGYKRIRDDPGLDAWRDTATLFVRLVQNGVTRSAGAIHIDMPGFLIQLRSMRVTAGGIEAMKNPDPTRVLWTLLSFSQFFFGELQRIYMPEIGVALRAMLKPPGNRSES